MTIRLRLTDYQLAVIEAMRATMGGLTLAELADAALSHEDARAAEPRWRAARPARRRISPRRSSHGFDALLPAACAGALRLVAGQVLRIEQTSDGQCVDLRVHELDGRAFSAGVTRSRHGINPSTGASLWSAAPERRLATIVADTAPGHDLCCAPCSEAEYRDHAGIAGHLGCAELLRSAWADPPHAAARSGDDVLNLWLASAIGDDGTLRTWPASARRGDHVRLRADVDLVVALSTCPDDLFGSSQYEPGPVRVIVEDGPPTLPLSWPAAAPASAVAGNLLSVPVPAQGLAQLEAVAARGWLGFTPSHVLRALLLRLHESGPAAQRLT